MPEAKKKKSTKKRTTTKPQLKVNYVPELCNREFADFIAIRYQETGLFAISFGTINHHQPNEGSVHTVIYMDETSVEMLRKGLNENLMDYHKSKK